MLVVVANIPAFQFHDNLPHHDKAYFEQTVASEVDDHHFTF